MGDGGGTQTPLQPVAICKKANNQVNAISRIGAVLGQKEKEMLSDYGKPYFQFLHAFQFDV